MRCDAEAGSREARTCLSTKRWLGEACKVAGTLLATVRNLRSALTTRTGALGSAALGAHASAESSGAALASSGSSCRTPARTSSLSPPLIPAAFQSFLTARAMIPDFDLLNKNTCGSFTFPLLPTWAFRHLLPALLVLPRSTPLRCCCCCSPCLRSPAFPALLFRTPLSPLSLLPEDSLASIVPIPESTKPAIVDRNKQTQKRPQNA